MYRTGWSRDLHLRWPSFYQHQEGLVLIERHHYLCRINLENGETLWEYPLGDRYGWITGQGDLIYYLRQDGGVLIIDFHSGKLMATHALDHRYLGYLMVNKNYLVTGAWRGYTDLMCWHHDAPQKLRLNWSKATKAQTITSYSLAKLEEDSLIFSNNKTRTLTKLDLLTGAVKWEVKLPLGVRKVDKGYNFACKEKVIIVYTDQGSIYSLAMDSLTWKEEIRHTCGIQTVQPKFCKDQYFFQDEENFICAYDSHSKKLRWKIYRNHRNFHLPILPVDHDKTLIGGNMSRQQIIDANGKCQYTLAAERRYGSIFMAIGEHIYYFSKSKLKQLRK